MVVDFFFYTTLRNNRQAVGLLNVSSRLIGYKKSPSIC